MWQYNYTDELYHHGIKGQKWGVRRYQNEDGSLTTAGKKRQAYKDAKQEYKRAVKARSQLNPWGYEGLQDYDKKDAAVTKARLNMITAKAEFRAAKASTQKKADKAEFNTYYKELARAGLPGSATDRSTDRASTKAFNHIKAKKGKEYAEKVAKKLDKNLTGELIAASVVAVGCGIASAYLNIKYPS